MLVSSYLAVAENPPAGQPAQRRVRGADSRRPQPMSFFVTSVGKGDGADLGALPELTPIASRWRLRWDEAASRGTGT